MSLYTAVSLGSRWEDWLVSQNHFYINQKAAGDAFQKREGSPAVFVYRLYCGLWVVLIYDDFLSASKVFPQGRHKNVHIDWLCDMVVHPGIQCRLSVLGKGVCRHRDNGDIRLLGVAHPSYHSCRIVAVHHGHLDIHKDDLIRSVCRLFQHIHTFHAVFCAVYRAAFLLQ